ncbi:MAG TPA: DNA alkylation repair protein [Pseudacidobacterium sp.]|nr:DNA alkylation repair protein [Pseudacidobacterium sp.]
MGTPSIRVQLECALKAAGNPERAAFMARYFKTGKGEYGEGDVFLGIAVPVLRKIALAHRDIDFADLQRLLDSKIHEYRAAALEILVSQYNGGDGKLRREIVAFYLKNTARINHWDLVDTSCRPILGGYLKTRPRKILRRLAKSKSLWERRIAMVSTMALVWDGELDDAIEIAEMLLDDDHDLIRKAVGWVLREVGVQDRAVLLAFIKKHYERIPRIALRYAIEHFTSAERKKVLAGKFT